MSNYTADEIPTQFAPHAEETLQRLSKRDDTVLIMYTCSYPAEIEKYQEFFKSRGIIFKYVNENPEAKNTAFGFFEKKLYCNIILDDKSSFDMHKDWSDIFEALDILDFGESEKVEFTALEYLRIKGWNLEDNNGYGLMGKGIADMLEEYHAIKLGK
jgi:hypothetical protein